MLAFIHILISLEWCSWIWLSVTVMRSRLILLSLTLLIGYGFSITREWQVSALRR